MRNAISRLFLLIISLLAATPAGADTPYRVESGNVDARTFIGWRVYHETCVTCHGADAITIGTAPSLLEAIDGYTATQFAMKVRSRYLVGVSGESRGSESGSAVREAFLAELQRHETADAAPVTMPIWDGHPLVHDRINAIYSYLRARAEGALSAGKPGVLKDGSD